MTYSNNPNDPLGPAGQYDQDPVKIRQGMPGWKKAIIGGAILLFGTAAGSYLMNRAQQQFNSALQQSPTIEQVLTTEQASMYASSMTPTFLMSQTPEDDEILSAAATPIPSSTPVMISAEKQMPGYDGKTTFESLVFKAYQDRISEGMDAAKFYRDIDEMCAVAVEAKPSSEGYIIGKDLSDVACTADDPNGVLRLDIDVGVSGGAKQGILVYGVRGEDGRFIEKPYVSLPVAVSHLNGKIQEDLRMNIATYEMEFEGKTIKVPYQVRVFTEEYQKDGKGPAIPGGYTDQILIDFSDLSGLDQDLDSNVEVPQNALMQWNAIINNIGDSHFMMKPGIGLNLEQVLEKDVLKDIEASSRYGVFSFIYSEITRDASFEGKYSCRPVASSIFDIGGFNTFEEDPAHPFTVEYSASQNSLGLWQIDEIALVCGIGGPSATSTKTGVPERSSTPTIRYSMTPTQIASLTPSITSTSTPRPTNTPWPTYTNTPWPTLTNTAWPTLTSTPRPTNTPWPTPTNTAWPTLTSTPRPTNTPEPTSTPWPTETEEPTSPPPPGVTPTANDP